MLNVFEMAKYWRIKNTKTYTGKVPLRKKYKKRKIFF